MPIVNNNKRSAHNQLGDMAKFFYEEVLLFHESDDFSSLRNSTEHKDYKNFTKSHAVELVFGCDKVSDKFVWKGHGKDRKLVLTNKFANEDISNKIIICSTQNRKFSSLFGHIRNAFAHNRINRDGDYITMYDSIDKDKTMIGHVSVSDIKELISCLKSIKKE